MGQGVGGVLTHGGVEMADESSLRSPPPARRLVLAPAPRPQLTAAIA